MMPESFGKTMIVVGLVLVAVGILFSLLPKLTGLPKLPGDILIKKDNFVLYFPWVSSLLISAILSLIFYLFLKK